jgi:glycosyltransferase involved in cell wall biosynthesis
MITPPPQCNIIIVGVSCFDGMATSMRVRNLFEPLIEKELVTVSNLIYEKSTRKSIGKKGRINNINFRVIGLANILAIAGFVFGGIGFIKKNKIAKKKNILYVYDYPDIKNISFILFAKLIGFKIVLDIVEDNSHEAPVGFINKFRIKTSLFLERFSKRLAHAMIGISNHLYKKLTVLANGKIPVYLIPITVNLNYFKKINYVSDRKDLRIFYGGSFGTKDGLEYLISAFDEISKKYSNVQLIFTGAGHQQDMDRVNAKINTVTYKDRILNKGFLSTEAYYGLLNECDIFCMTRINSKFANAGFPFKLGEFLASGKAVIATNVGDVSDFLKNEVNALLIAPDSVTEIVNALTEIIEHPQKIRSLGMEARKTAEDHFDTEKVSMKLLSIFNEL